MRRLKHGSEARAALRRGIDAVAEAVRVTLGPGGRTVLLHRSPDKALGETDRLLTITNDGVTVARELALADPFENQGAQLLREVAGATRNATGDGTTTASLLAQAIVREGLRSVEAGADPNCLRRGIEAAVDQVVDDLRSRQSIEVATTAQTARVAALAAGDDEIGELVASAFEQVGADGIVNVEPGGTVGIELEIVEGLRWDHGYIAPDMITDRERIEAVLDDPYVLLADQKISDAYALLPIVEQVKQAGKPLFVVAQDMDGEALAMLLVNKLLGNLQVVVTRAPGFVLRRRRMLDDMAVYTGGVTVSEEAGLTLEGLELSQLGRARRVVAERQRTTVIGGRGDEAEIRGRRESLRRQMETADIAFHAKVFKERLDRLAGRVALIQVGAHTETEIRERELRVHDAVHAARAALGEGLLPGGGVALLNARAAIDPAGLGSDEAVGAEIIRRALAEPARQIAANSGFEGSIALDRSGLGPNEGLDVTTGAFVDLVEAGVVDPTKVTRTALQNAASVAKTILATEVIVADVST